MPIPNSPLVQSRVFFENTVIPERFSMVCWNVHKENLRREFQNRILAYKSDYGLDLILLQEAWFSNALHSVGGFPYVAAANLQLRHYSGVVTAAVAPPDSSRFHMTHAKEPFVFTPKNSLITVYRFKDKTSLVVVNIHAINFRSLAWYQWEMTRLAGVLKAYPGAMVVAGDFNCWRKSRERALEQFTDLLGLTLIRPENNNRVKRIFGFTLDRVYYRGLTLEKAQALRCNQISDHNPIIVRFSKC